MPVLIWPNQLDDQETMAYVDRVYAAGLTVGILQATQSELNRFDTLVEGVPVASCKVTRGKRPAALYAVQRSLNVLPVEITRSCLPKIDASLAEANSTETQWLRERFGLYPPPPPLDSTEIKISNNSVNLESLSQKIHCDDLIGNENGQMQQDVFVTSVRSFDAQRDYYYVQKFDQFRPRFDNYTALYTAAGAPAVKVSENGYQRLEGTRLFFTEPDTTLSYVDSYTNSRETTVTGGVGFSGLSLEVRAELSVTVGKSTSVRVPPIEIRNISTPLNGVAGWQFYPQRAVGGLLYSTAESWVWYIDRDVYPDSGENLNELFSEYGAGIFGNHPLLHGDYCGFPPPFPTFVVGDPHIDSVEPAKTYRGGGTFLIHGEQMYPGIVSAVLLGGDPLAPANFVSLDDKTIRVVVPSGQKVGSTPVQVNTYFGGKTLFSNNNVKIDIRP